MPRPVTAPYGTIYYDNNNINYIFLNEWKIIASFDFSDFNDKNIIRDILRNKLIKERKEKIMQLNGRI